jgi:hypothetical protein
VTAICLKELAEFSLRLFKWWGKKSGKAMKRSFRKYDTDHSGTLNLEEVRLGLRHMGLIFDRDSRELHALLMQFGHSPTDLEFDFETYCFFVEFLSERSDIVSQKAAMTFTITLELSLMLLVSILFAYLEDWGVFDSWYFLVVTLTTVGLGDYYPATAEGRALTVVFALFSMGLLASILGFIQEKIEAQNLQRETEVLKRAIHKAKERRAERRAIRKEKHAHHHHHSLSESISGFLHRGQSSKHSKPAKTDHLRDPASTEQQTSDVNADTESSSVSSSAKRKVPVKLTFGSSS